MRLYNHAPGLLAPELVAALFITIGVAASIAASVAAIRALKVYGDYNSRSESYLKIAGGTIGMLGFGASKWLEKNDLPIWVRKKIRQRTIDKKVREQRTHIQGQLREGLVNAGTSQRLLDASSNEIRKQMRKAAYSVIVFIR